jgi:hypothetical protein
MSVVDKFKHSRYPPEVLGEEEDDGTMVDNLEEFSKHVIGHKIVKVETVPINDYYYAGLSTDREKFLRLTLDNGIEVELRNDGDCCAYTNLDGFWTHPELVDHVIMGVGTTDGFQTWHIYADFGDIMKLNVDWSCGNPFYYGYGFDIKVNVAGDVIDGVLHPSPQKMIEGK